MRKLLIILVLCQVHLLVAQSKKNQIEQLQLTIDSLTNVMNTERILNKDIIEKQVTQIDKKDNEIQLFNEKVKSCEQKIKSLTEANVQLTNDYDKTLAEKTYLEKQIKNLPVTWQYSPTMEKNLESGELEYKFILSKGGIEIISFLQFISEGEAEPQIENLKIKSYIVDNEYEYLVNVMENGEIEIAYNIFSYDINDSKLKYNQWIKTLKQIDYQNWVVIGCTGRCE